MANLGFKVLTTANWLESDEVNKAFVMLDSSGVRGFTADDWLAEALAPKLGTNVPDEIQRLYEVARGAIVYGYFFHPLRALGLEQLYRVAEAAVEQKCQQLGMATSKVTFHDQIEWLARGRQINPAETAAWHRVRQGRNFVSHLQDQMIAPPGWATLALSQFAVRITALFP